MYLYPPPALCVSRVTPHQAAPGQAGLGWAGGQQPCYHPPATHVVTPWHTTPLLIHPDYSDNYVS